MKAYFYHSPTRLADDRTTRPDATHRVPDLEVVQASNGAPAHGVEAREIEGVEVKLTTPSKTVAGCFRYRRHVGLDVALDALKDYLRKRTGSIDALEEAARAGRISSVMEPYLEAPAAG